MKSHTSNDRKRPRENNTGPNGVSKNASKEPVLPWMRQPLEIDSVEEVPLELVPCLDLRLEDALRNTGVKSLFPVQVATWQEIVGPGAAERDLCVCSPTGSGKTLSYALPIVQLLSKRKLQQLRALVVLPTRDLAMQVKTVFDSIAPAVGLSVGLAVGQSSIAAETAQFVKYRKNPMYSFMDYEERDLSITECCIDILIATPGRLMDHINTTKGFTLEHLCYLVVDETDRLLREAYQYWLPNVLNLVHIKSTNLSRDNSDKVSAALLPLTTSRQSGVERGFKGKQFPRVFKMILSATLTRDPSKLSQLALHQPLFLNSSTKEKRYKIPKELKIFTLICESKLKPVFLVALLQKLKGEKTIVFTSSVTSTHRLSILLNCFKGLDIKISEYSGLQHQSLRSKALGMFRTGDVQVLVSSDAMTRGMDVEGVLNVVNYDMPAYVKTFVHRAGRTARAGRSGSCFTLLRKNEVKRFRKQVEKASDIPSTECSLPADSVENLHPYYHAALEKLKEVVESEATGKDKSSQEIFTENTTEEWIEAANEETA